MDEDIYIEYATQTGHNIKTLVEERLSTLKKMEFLQKDAALRALVEAARIRPRAEAAKEQMRRIRELQ